MCNDINAELLDLNNRDDICHKKVHELVANKSFASRVEETILSVINNKIVQVNLYTFNTNKGNLVSWLNVMQPDFDSENKVCGVIGFGIPLSKSEQSFVSNNTHTQGLTNIVKYDSEFHHPLLKDLTNREQTILNMLLRGYSCKRIGNKLCISSRTVETHISNIKSKFAVTSRDDLIDLCYESGLAVILNYISC